MNTQLNMLLRKIDWLRMQIELLQPSYDVAVKSGSSEALKDIYAAIINAKLKVGTALVSNAFKMSLIAENESEECEKTLRNQYRENVRNKIGDIKTLHDANDQAFLDCSELRMKAIEHRAAYESAKELSQIIKGLEISLSHSIGETKQ